MFKKIFSVLLMIALFSGSCLTSVYAYEFPNAFWKMNEAYIKAVDSNDRNSIIKYGKQIIDLMSKETLAEPVISVLADRSQRLANVYAELGKYEESAKMFEFFIPYGEKMKWTDSIIIAKAKIPQYKSKVELYTDNGLSPYYGSRNEPENGVLFGTVADSPTRDLIPNESALLIYHELGTDIVFDLDERMMEASENGLTVEFALNCPGEGSDISNFDYKKYDIANVSNFLSNFPDVPVLLRFGAEVNVWSNLPDPEQYKEAFRYVSDYMRNNNPNVAMVWSPGAVSKWGQDMNVYYPGDEYVDWVGVSLYSMKYFEANPNREDYEQVVFKTGANADPVLAMQEIIEKYGNRKPIMLSESGQSAYVHSGYVDEDTTDWAIQKMTEEYSYLPMVYPQIKFIAYFDQYMPNEANDYSLKLHPRLQDNYVKMTTFPRFIKGDNQNATVCYRPLYDNIIADGVLPVSCYAHIYKDSVKSVSYFVDGVHNSTSSQMPYTSYIDLSHAPGMHTIKAVIETNNGQRVEKEYKVNVAAQKEISVTINGEKVAFDQQPLSHNNRTLVPLRAIFEALGATVEWNPDTQTATGRKGGDVVSFTIGSDILSKNENHISLDVPAMPVGGRTLVPVRAISESFGCNVGWDQETQTVIITK